MGGLPRLDRLYGRRRNQVTAKRDDMNNYTKRYWLMDGRVIWHTSTTLDMAKRVKAAFAFERTLRIIDADPIERLEHAHLQPTVEGT